MSSIFQSSARSQLPALRSFEALWQARPADSLSAVRERAMQRFLELGLPTTHDESWKYSDLRSLAARSCNRPSTLLAQQPLPPLFN